MAEVDGGRFARTALMVVLAVGVALRVENLFTAPIGGDAYHYVELARRFTFLDPWRASYREPVWTALSHVAIAPADYSESALKAFGFVVSVVALVACRWALRVVFPERPWLLVAGFAAVAVSPDLVGHASGANRDGLSLVIVALLVGLVVRRPEWLPMLGAVALGIRWEIGTAILVVTVVLAIGRVVPWRWLAAGAALAVFLVGPFLVNNARHYGDPMFHSNIHATVNRNLEAHGGISPHTAPEHLWLDPLITSENWQGPLISWSEYAIDTVGAGEVMRREVEAVATLPVWALRFGVLPWAAGVALAGLAVFGVVTRRDRLAVAIVGMVGAGVAGYGLALPVLPLRLVSSLSFPLVVLALSGAVDTGRLVSRGLELAPELDVAEREEVVAAGVRSGLEDA